MGSKFFGLWYTHIYVDTLLWAYYIEFDLEVWWEPSFLACGMWILYYGHISTTLIRRYGGMQFFAFWYVDTLSWAYYIDLDL